MKNLGFGMMRLPVISGPEDFDYLQIEQMVDLFLEQGFTYFDTSYVYHNGQSETAVRKALVERHPRDAYTIATKFPTFMMIPEEQIEELFQSQLDRLGVTYVDYYLLHNIQNVYYEGYDGQGGIVQKTHLFEHAKKWKEEGRIRHLGISFHSSAKLLDRVLSEHPEIEFVQIALNPIDWDSELVQAGLCYEVIRKYGRKVVVMEAVKGGGLAKLPAEAESMLKAAHPDWSIASWAVRFSLDLEDVIAVLSGMSSVEQVRDNTRTANTANPLTKEDRETLSKAMALYRESAPIPQSQIDAYKGLMYHGVPVTAILQAYSICQIQPDPGFSDDNNYLKNAIIEAERIDFTKGLSKQYVITKDGKDITEMIETAVTWLTEHTF